MPDLTSIAACFVSSCCVYNSLHLAIQSSTHSILILILILLIIISKNPANRTHSSLRTKTRQSNHHPLQQPRLISVDHRLLIARAPDSLFHPQRAIATKAARPIRIPVKASSIRHNHTQKPSASQIKKPTPKRAILATIAFGSILSAVVGTFIYGRSRDKPNHKMASKLVPKNPSDVMVIRDVTPNVVTFSVPFLRFGRVPIGGRGTLGKMLKSSL